MQVEYKRIDGTVIVFSANTKIFTKTHVGSIIPGVTTPEHIAKLEALPDAKILVKLQTINGVTNVPVKVFVVTSEVYVTDYGLHIWAGERLTQAEQVAFAAQVNNPIKVRPDNENPGFLHWWQRYITDPNVKVTE